MENMHNSNIGNNINNNNNFKPAEQIGGFAPRRRSGRTNKSNNQQNQQQQQLQMQQHHQQQQQQQQQQHQQQQQQHRQTTGQAQVSSEPPISIEDALKTQDIPSMAMKTPVSILQELLSRRGITPSYELVQIEGAIHEPTFRYRVSFNDKEIPFTAMGAGRSKKEAKHAAAKALIDKLTGVMTPDLQNLNNSVPHNGEAQTVLNSLGDNSYEEKVQGNPIGWLQEMCMARRWPPPTYETEMEVGLPHERQFTIACTILKYREVGRGKSKKVAKRLAAHKMWTRLQENPLEHSQISQVLDEDGNDDSRVVLNRYGDLKESHVPILTSHYSQKVAQFHRALKSATGEKLSKLQTTCLNDTDVNYVQFLEELAMEHEFEVTYVDIEERTYSGRCQCLVQLSSLPVAVCHGSGSTSKEAQSNAAHNALEYLKIMTKK